MTNDQQARFQAWLKRTWPEADTTRINGAYRNSTIRAQFEAWCACEAETASRLSSMASGMKEQS